MLSSQQKLLREKSKDYVCIYLLTASFLPCITYNDMTTHAEEELLHRSSVINDNVGFSKNYNDELISLDMILITE